MSKTKRFQLMNPGVKKYTLYAIGEMILVVLSILIALSINNWNNDRQRSQSIDQTLKMVIEDLSMDTVQAGVLVRHYDATEEYFKKSMNDSLSKAELKACVPCHGLISSIAPFTPQLRGYDILKNYEVSLDTPKDSLIHLVTQFYSQSSSHFELINDMIREDVNGNLIEWKTTQPWYANWINRVPDNRFYDYMHDNELYKNKIANHYLLIFKNFLPYLRAYQEQATMLADKINDLMED